MEEADNNKEQLQNDQITNGNEDENTKSGRTDLDEVEKADDALSQLSCVATKSTNVQIEDNVGLIETVIGDFYDDHEIEINKKCIDQITQGVVQNMMPSLEKAKVSVEETLKNQEVLLETVQQENAKFEECSSMGNLVEMMQEAKLYYNKLICVKRDMNFITDKTTKLKRKAVKLQQQKQREEQYLLQRREKELEKEQQLIARVVKKNDNSNAQSSEASNQ